MGIVVRDGYELSTDPSRINLGRVHRWLSEDSYWALGRSLQVQELANAGSLVCGIYRIGNGAQVGFARAVTDGATFGWLCDVYVDPADRGRGLGRWLAEHVRDELFNRGVRRILLSTADAHGVYAGVGFAALATPERWMELDQR
ncbi:GNAT family N-acetyltransferase [Plantactinospora sp. GCM10030261]|uniref:GNAT family N-acetyltransferase n=1 Tax=Plantactinospora sp. GCM10030261 TaxID=3273420 RepID=UPI0036081D69